MDLRQLGYFRTVARELHFRKAAEQLCIVQPALTRQIKQLEGELGVVLFHRTKRRVELTEAGAYRYREVEALFARIESVTRNVRSIHAGQMGTLRISYAGSAMVSLLPPILARLREQWPLVQTHLHEMTASEQLEAVRDGKADVGFVRNPPPDDRLHQRVVQRETFSVVLPGTHPLASASFRGLAQLAGEPFILPPRSSGPLYVDALMRLCGQAGFTPVVAHETAFGDTVMRLVAQGLGVALVPTSLTRGVTLPVACFELPDAGIGAELSMIWRKDDLNPLVRHLADSVPEMGPTA
ncbi:MAG: LysR family transcriptional regulator [Cytophagales bacterium]|nr:LysR family transcriptional regulator [Cytophagales bacterium]